MSPQCARAHPSLLKQDHNINYGKCGVTPQSATANFPGFNVVLANFELLKSLGRS
jgi:hypothetical protein